MATLKQFRQKQFNQSRNNGSRPDNGRNPLTLPTKDRVPENGTTPSTGTRAFRVVLQNEDPNAFRTLREALLRDWIPASSFEHALVIDIADARWRLARYTTFETAAIDFEIERMRAEVARHSSTSTKAPAVSSASTLSSSTTVPSTSSSPSFASSTESSTAPPASSSGSASSVPIREVATLTPAPVPVPAAPKTMHLQPGHLRKRKSRLQARSKIAGTNPSLPSHPRLWPS